jgi:hypothetical protein
MNIKQKANEKYQLMSFLEVQKKCWKKTKKIF